ncbi:MAG: hypothetical protein ACRBCK_08325 [Alphaproteobacteria bacterium]
MSEAFLKAVKWYVLVACAITGTSAFIIADKSGSVKPVIFGVVTYGIVYIMSYFWTEFRGKLLLFSILVFIVLTFASSYVPIAMYVLFAMPPELFDPYYTWGATVGVLGVPAMTLVFHRYD